MCSNWYAWLYWYHWLYGPTLRLAWGCGLKVAWAGCFGQRAPYAKHALVCPAQAIPLLVVLSLRHERIKFIESFADAHNVHWLRSFKQLGLLKGLVSFDASKPFAQPNQLSLFLSSHFSRPFPASLYLLSRQ